MRWILPACLCLLSACSSAPPPKPPADVQMQQAGRAGQLDLSLDHPREAAQQFRTALGRAQLRDDLPAIVDYAYDLAAAELADNQPQAALSTVRDVKAELARRNSPAVPGLDLLEAIALYRAGSRAEADALAAPLEQSSERDVAGQACFLRGLIADERNDLAGLEAAQRCASQPANGASAANALELSVRLSLRRGDAATSETMAEKAADLRRESRDYRGMARALALAGSAAQQAGANARAGSFYLRAGRSAAAQGDTANARKWLQTALSLSLTADLHAQAQRLLSEVQQ
jgi:hypothetical protein